ncbi:MAG: InlB B-repeat-containing protein, partial [Clostridia bacterium]|nr:InlB B-repeat-containing protein [Clostridia bacterium]
MKKLVTTLLVAIMVIVSAFSFTACSGEGVSIKDTYVDDNNHIIVEFTDGSKKDLGTVEEIIPVYTVTFVDINGNIIETQQVYKGLSAKAPTAPQIPDQVFSGWSVDITNIQGNITVSPVYGNMATFTVTFKDEQGNTLKTETVISGRSATAPTNLPAREDTIFDRWDKSFNNVTGDMTVTAIYRAKKDCIVTFKDYSGITLGTATVKEGGNVTAPVTPSREGYTFKGWSSSLNNVTGDKSVTAQYTLNSANNIFDISYKVNGNNVTVTLSLAGTVCLAGFEGTLSFEGMNVVNATAKSNNMI